MTRGKGKGKGCGSAAGDIGDSVSTYRHKDAKRKNNPPAALAAEGMIPAVPKVQYHYSPRRPPVLRFDPKGGPDKLPELVAEAGRRPLTKDEQNLLAEALRNQQPWLEWAEKAEQHQRNCFEVDPVALHIHERISTQAILKVAAREDVQKSLFADPVQEYHDAVQFYKHDIDWTNRLILGDSLQVMSSLARREDLAGKVQMIYIDPPYGIKFASNFQPEVGRRDVKDKEQDLTRELEMVKAYRDTWHLGIHSYLSYLRDRLILARELLADAGSIFLQIGEENVHRVRVVMDEVFGAENFISLITVRKTATPSNMLDDGAFYLLWYARKRELAQKTFRPLHRPKPCDEWARDTPGGSWRVEIDGIRRALTPVEKQNTNILPVRAQVYCLSKTTSAGGTSDPESWEVNGKAFSLKSNEHWKTGPKGRERLLRAARIEVEGRPWFTKFHSDGQFKRMNNVWEDTAGKSGESLYVVQTQPDIVARCMLMTTNPGDLVLDPTCGSGTTAYVAEQWGRRWITIDTSRVAVAIARHRLLAAKYERYKVNGEDRNGNGGAPRPEIDPHPGFVYRTVPHITLKKIAQNQNLDPIFAKHEPVLERQLLVCNTALSKVTDAGRTTLSRKLLSKERDQGRKSVTDADRRRWELPTKGSKWEHWEIPFDTDPDWPKELQEAVEAYRDAWRAKMAEVNACIAANADQEELVDQPEAVKGVVRVSGPFTVEAVQPPELSLSEGLFGGEPESLQAGFTPRVEMDERNLHAYLEQMTGLIRLDGVRFPNNQEMAFARLDPIYEDGSGSGLHAEGCWGPKGKPGDSTEGRVSVAVVFGPQYGPVTSMQVVEAIRSAFRRGYADLVVAGFSFDAAAYAEIEASKNPKLRVHIAHIRPDVNPGMSGLLKQTANSQLFTVFGEPRVTLHGPNKQGEYTVTMDGVDIYDPVKNVVLPTSADKVAAWFLDGDYDGQTFCVTQAFFPDKSAWEKLAKALGDKGVVDTNVFEQFAGTESLPFPAGPHKCVAVKVIDPRGNEVMSVHRLK